MTPAAPRAYPRPAARACSRTAPASSRATSRSTSSCSCARPASSPLGLVIGSSIYHIGCRWRSYRQNQELTVLSQAMYEARELAMTRMEEEAEQLGADGVVGVRLDIGRYEWGENLAEFIAVGTAVKHARRRAPPRALGPPVHERPLGPGVLDAAADRPPPGRHGDGLVRLPRRPPDAAPEHAQHGPERRARRTSRRRSTTRASWRWSGCRPRRSRPRPRASSASTSHESSHGWGSHVIEFFAIGTAIIPSEGAEDHVIPAPQTVLDLS